MTRSKHHQMRTRTLLRAWTAGLTMIASAAIAQETPSALSETYGDWVVSCQQVQAEAQTQQACQMSQELRQQNSNQRVLSVGIVAQTGTAAATFIVPFGLSLSDGAVLMVDEITSIDAMDFRTCLPAGCILRTTFEEDTLATLRAGAQMQIILQPLDSAESFPIGVSLAGFSAALDRLKTLQEQ